MGKANISSKPLMYYIQRFRKMNRYRKNGEVAPHKSMMLIAVMDQIANGNLTNGFVPINQNMYDAVMHTWSQYYGMTKQTSFTYPFFHLASEDWWHLIKTDSYIERKEYSSFNSLRASFYGAILPDDLWDYMADEGSRQLLKFALLETLEPKPQQQPVHIAAEPTCIYNSKNDDLSNQKDMAA